jgi:large subunit ribosomal protein L24
MMHVKKNDTVVVLTGKDKEKTGTVIAVLPKQGKIMVSGIAIRTKHVKAKKQGEVSAIKKQESYISLSNVMPICRSCKKPCRVSVAFLEDGKKARMCSNCKETL